MIETETLAKLMTKPAIMASIPLFKKLKDNISHFMNDGFLDYFLLSLEKYKNLKTLLHRQPTNFYDIYYPTTLTNHSETFKTDSINSLFTSSNCITIIGDAGSGKSTLLKHLFINSFMTSYKAPILITLRDLDVKKSNLKNFICENILNNNLSPSDTYLIKLLKEGNFLFFLDGYDEIKSDDKHEITKNIENFIDAFPKNNYILTSRPYSNIEYFKNFENLYICDLSEEEQVLFIEKQIINILSL